MRFLVDAQLPARLAQLLAAAGYETIHTSLPLSTSKTAGHRLALAGRKT